MNKSEQKALEAYPDAMGPCDKPCLEDDARVTRKLREAFQIGYERALSDIETVVRQYEKKGSRMMDESGEAGEQGGYTFWDGFHNCACNISRELK